jgi:hypothetical protein
MPLFRHILPRLALAALVGLCSMGAAAQTAAAKPATLAVSGRADARTLTRQDLEQLPQHAFRTATPWYRTPRTFEGPLLRDVLALVHASGSVIRAPFPPRTRSAST